MISGFKVMDTRYIVKKDEGVVVCILQVSTKSGCGYFEVSGVSKCLPSDSFNEEFGKILARKKAFKKKNMILRSLLLDRIKKIEKELADYSGQFLKIDDACRKNEEDIRFLSQSLDAEDGLRLISHLK